MERLTFKNQDVSHVENFINKHSNFDGIRIANCLRRLAEYEDTGLTPQNIICREDDIKLLQKQNKEFRKEIYRLRQEHGYWEREAKKWCSKLGEIRIAMSKER